MESPNKNPKILVVDDDKITRELLRGILEAEGYPVDVAASGEEAVRALTAMPYPLVLSDVNMLGLGGLGLLSHVVSSGTNTVMILITSYGSLEGAVEAIQKGAFDYISKPLKPEQLKSVIARAVQHWRSRNAPPKATASVPLARSLIGTSPSIVSVYKTVAKATLNSSNVLIFGESGTGKELIARAIHSHSVRSHHPFVTVNCGALTETLLESELFGHVKGSFTGAIANKKGLFDEANGGTIFLDEIGDITPALQVKLLRVIQEGEFKPVGSTEDRKVDARLIAATHRDLDSLVREGKFREDLYYRLKVILIEIPPLRKRMEDLPELINHFLGRYSENSARGAYRISPEALELLRSYSWPGNIRELEHAIERAVAMANANTLYPEDFPPEVQTEHPPVALGTDGAAPSEEPTNSSLEQMEKAHIVRILRSANFNKSRAANILGIDRATLYRKAQRYGIPLGEEKVS